MKIDYQEKIDDYVLGKMSAKDRDIFEKEVSLDKEMQEQLELTLNVRDAIKSRQEKLAMMQEWENKSTGSNRKVMAWASSVVGIAAMFAIGFFLIVPKEETDVNFNSKETQVYKRLGDSKMYFDETIKENSKFEKLTEERSLYLKEKVELFIYYLHVLQDKGQSASIKGHYYKKVVDFLIDSQLAEALGKDDATISIVKENSREHRMLLRNYLQRFKEGVETLGKLRKIELYEVDENSIREGYGHYMCDICTHVFSLEEGMGHIHSVRETVTVDLDSKETLEKNGGVFIGKIEINR